MPRHTDRRETPLRTRRERRALTSRIIRRRWKDIKLRYGHLYAGGEYVHPDEARRSGRRNPGSRVDWPWGLHLANNPHTRCSCWGCQGWPDGGARDREKRAWRADADAQIEAADATGTHEQSPAHSEDPTMSGQ